MASVLSLLKDFMSQYRVLTATATIVGTGAVVFVIRKSREKPYNRKCGVDYPKDKVIVQAGFSKGRYTPTLGQFCLKLMTYLRVAGIPYEVQFLSVPGPKRKIPWIEYNGTVMGDSQFIINFLNETFDKNLNRSLSAEQRALAWAIQKWIEEFIYWMNVHTRWCLYYDEFMTEDVEPRLRSPVLKAFLKKYIGKMTYMVGIGRHTKEEISEMIQFELRQFSAILGNKKYIMGDVMTEVDCAAFGILGQIYYQTPVSCAGRQLLIKADEMQNVRDYLSRIKTQYWPDWDSLTMD